MMKSNNNKNKESARELLKLLGVIVAIGLWLLSMYLSTVRDEKIMDKQGVDTTCVMVAYAEGGTGQRGPKKGYHNQFEYRVDGVIHHCYVFTSVKPLPIGMKLNVRYLKKKDGNVTINFPDVYKEQYKEYGFNDYGY